MGFSGISPMSLLLILIIVLVLFGSNKLKTLGSDLGQAIQHFRKAMQEDRANQTDKDQEESK